MENQKILPIVRAELLTVLALYLFMVPVSWPLGSFMIIPVVNIVVAALMAFLLPLMMYNGFVKMFGDRMRIPKEKLFLSILFTSALELFAFRFAGETIEPARSMDMATMILPVLGGTVLAFVFGRIFNR